MKLQIQLLFIIGLLFLNIDLQAVTSEPTQKNVKSEVVKYVQNLKKSTKQFLNKTKSKIKKIVKANKENMVALGFLIFLLLVGSLLTFIILKLTMVITWSWAVVLIPLYILTLLFLYALIPSKSK